MLEKRLFEVLASGARSSEEVEEAEELARALARGAPLDVLWHARKLRVTLGKVERVVGVFKILGVEVTVPESLREQYFKSRRRRVRRRERKRRREIYTLRVVREKYWAYVEKLRREVEERERSR